MDRIDPHSLPKQAAAHYSMLYSRERRLEDVQTKGGKEIASKMATALFRKVKGGAPGESNDQDKPSLESKYPEIELSELNPTDMADLDLDRKVNYEKNKYFQRLREA